ncbi:MAG: glycosyltransferase family 9 protein, partial [Opitutales bacterium]
MSWKRTFVNGVIGGLAAVAAPRRAASDSPASVFVLRNNDLGDVLTATPLFDALKRLWPKTRVLAGVGDWARPLLAHNPHVDEILSINAPWHNHVRARHPPNSLRGLADALRYLGSSPEVRALCQRRCAVGVDVLGSPPGTLLLLRAGIPRRVGVRGYAGGDRGCTDVIVYSENEYVGRSALRQAGALGLAEDRWPAARPQVFLPPEEQAAAEATWQVAAPSRRLLVGLGGGYPAKCWPLSHVRALLETLTQNERPTVLLVGGPADRAAGAELAQGLPGVQNLAGTAGLRDTLALTASAGRVLCNSSFVMHAAAAFDRPTVVVLGPAYSSARAHAAQWSCNPNARVLGPESDQPGLTPPAAVAAALRALPPAEP